MDQDNALNQTKEAFESLYLNEPFQSDIDPEIIRLIEGYVDDMEKVDNLTCNGPMRGGEITPSNLYELQVINNYEYKKRKVILEKMMHMGYHWKEAVKVFRQESKKIERYKR